jgi:hypothetical protein
MDRVGLSLAGNAVILDEGDARELHAENLDTPLPTSFPHNLGQPLDDFPGADGLPCSVCQCGAYLPSACICDSVFQVGDFKQCALDVTDAPGYYCVEANRVTILCSGGKSGKMIRARSDVLVKYLIDVKREAPVKSGLEFAFENPQPAEGSTFEWIKYNEGDKPLEDRSEDLPQLIEHRFLLEGKF